MSYQSERDEYAGNSAAAGRNGPNIALIVAAIVAVLALVFFLQNSEEIKLELLFFDRTMKVRWAIFFAFLLGVVVDRLFGFWWRRRRD